MHFQKCKTPCSYARCSRSESRFDKNGLVGLLAAGKVGASIPADGTSCLRQEESSGCMLT